MGRRTCMRWRWRNRDGARAWGEPSAAVLAADEVFEEGFVELHAGVERDVIDARLKAFFFVEGAEALQLTLIVLPVTAGIDDDFFLRLGVLELDHSVVGEVDLGLVEDVEQNDVVAAVSQPAEGLKDGSRLGQEIRKDHDYASVWPGRDDVHDRVGSVGLARRLQIREERQDVAEISAPGLNRHHITDAHTQRDQADAY